MGDDANHGDGCRCAARCREKFKAIDPTRIGNAPVLPADSPLLRGAQGSPPTAALPHGDPCPRCCASSTSDDPRDRFCRCVKCPTCDVLCGEVCAYCEASLGCRKHHVDIAAHVATACTATAERRHQVDEAVRTGGDLPLLAAN